MKRTCGLVVLFVSAFSGAVSAQTTVTVDAGKPHQKMFGFGATNLSLSFTKGADNLSTSLRERAIKACYGDVGISTGNVNIGPQETPGAYDQQANDNADPAVFNWAGFSTWQSDAMKEKVVDPATKIGFSNWYLAGNVSIRWAAKWMDGLRASNRAQFLAECAESASAAPTFWKSTYGVTTPLQMLFNEPTSGNGELLNGSTQDVVDIVKAAGARLQADGMNVKFVVPGEETEERSLEVATAILADAEAKKYVGAIAFHTYPYGSKYCDVPTILATSGSGAPDSDRIAVRGKLRDLAARNQVPLFMSEVSNGGVDPRSFDDLRGRAIHIHDELSYADASAYFGMNNMWDSTAQNEHFGNTNLWTSGSEGTIVLIDTPADKVVITGMGYAIGHYARWIRAGAVRLEATSDDKLVLVTAFRDDTLGRLVVVAINNATTEKALTVNLTGLSLDGNVEGERSTADNPWLGITPFAAAADSLKTSLPAFSVTSLSVQIAGAVETPLGSGGAPSAGGSSATDNSSGNGGRTQAAGGASGSGKAGAGAAQSNGGGVSGEPAVNAGGGLGPASAASTDHGCGCRLAARPAGGEGPLALLLGLGLGGFVTRRLRAGRRYARHANPFEATERSE